MSIDQKKIRSNQFPRTIRDGAVAAAIGVGLYLSQLSDSSGRIKPVPQTETPWIFSARQNGAYTIPDWQTRDRNGNLSGWKSVPGEWRSKR